MSNGQQDMSGKICLITGSSRGIGYETAAELARRGAHVIVVSHNQERTEAAVVRIKAESGEDAAHYYVADLSVQDQIHKLAEAVQRDYDHLDVLINNVGGWFRQFERSADGIEMTFALNHLSYFLLTGLLLPMLNKSAPARIVNVASDAHRQARGIQFDDIQYQQRYRPYAVYAQSKLANLLFTYELARRLESKQPTVNALHPGFVKSQLYRHFGIITPIVNFFAGLVGKNEKEGAQTSIYLASSPEVSDVTGKYFDECKPRKSSPASYDQSQAEHLWQVSEDLTGFSYPE